ncbi:MAG TPA: hypothetical protein PLR78_17505, partial [Polaromonas sp.]|uniref:hypothetical protein n=1 Tax=Polaromonas sp. TaxID=1869339 RepID=UPI002CCEF6CF
PPPPPPQADKKVVLASARAAHENMRLFKPVSNPLVDNLRRGNRLRTVGWLLPCPGCLTWGVECSGATTASRNRRNNDMGPQADKSWVFEDAMVGQRCKLLLTLKVGRNLQKCDVRRQARPRFLVAFSVFRIVASTPGFGSLLAPPKSVRCRPKNDARNGLHKY